MKEIKDIFKVGDRVFHIQNGWGTVGYSPKQNYYLVDFDNNSTAFWYTKFNNKVLSFTEYTLEGFSQDRKDIDPAYFGWDNPVLSRKEVFKIIDDELNSTRGKSDIFFISKIKEKLRALAFINSEKTLKEQ